MHFLAQAHFRVILKYLFLGEASQTTMDLVRPMVASNPEGACGVYKVRNGGIHAPRARGTLWSPNEDFFLVSIVGLLPPGAEEAAGLLTRIV